MPSKVRPSFRLPVVITVILLSCALVVGAKSFMTRADQPPLVLMNVGPAAFAMSRIDSREFPLLRVGVSGGQLWLYRVTVDAKPSPFGGLPALASPTVGGIGPFRITRARLFDSQIELGDATKRDGLDWIPLNAPTRSTEHHLLFSTPIWVPVFILLLYPVVVVWRGSVRRFRRCREGVCRGCGYNLTGNVSGRCPECGAPVVPGNNVRS